MKHASVPFVTAWLTVIGWYLTCWVSMTTSELVNIDMVNSARCHVRCLSITQVHLFDLFNFLRILVNGEL